MKRIMIFTSLLLVFVSTIIVYAGTHDGHYDKYSFLFLEPWERDDALDIVVDYYYSNDGLYNYSYRINKAMTSWTNAVDPYMSLEFNNVTSETDAELVIYSDDYGNIGWTGIAYHSKDPKKIQLNEWFQKEGTVNGHTYTYECYETTSLHELGHAHGLDHYDCNSEIMRPYHIHIFTPNEGDIDGMVDIY